MTASKPFLPEELADWYKVCPECGRRVDAGLWEELEHPYILVYPNGTKGEKGAWIPQSINSKCQCGANVPFEINFKKLSTGIYLFGDEAERELENFFLHAYTIIGGTSGPIRELREGLLDIKSTYIPDCPPDSWKVHAFQMMDSRKRATHSVYKKLNKAQTLSFFEDIANLMFSLEKHLWNHHVLAIYKRKGLDKKANKKTYKYVKATAHNALLSQLIYKTTKQNLRPFFTLDASKAIAREPHIEGWSYNTYNKSRYYFAHTLISHANDIEAPKFVQPGSHPCLEIADVHAFFAARYVLCRFKNTESEIDIRRFGKFCYIMMESDQKVNFHIGNSIPDAWISRK